jgi:hypothetical protein
MKENTNISVAVTGSPSWPRYFIVNANKHYWNDKGKEWTNNLGEASMFANTYTLKSVVSEIEEAAHEKKSVRYYEGNVVVKVRCNEDYSEEELRFHLAKCVNIQVSRQQPEQEDSIQDAWIGVTLPWGTLTEISEEDYERYD